MTISIDSNLIAALWDTDHPMNVAAVEVLGKLIVSEKLIVCGPVYAELMAGPLRDEAALDMFFKDTGIEIDWAMDEKVWREAGRAYLAYVQRRRTSRGGDARRILPDFIIGAHALVRDYSVLTLDGDDYATAFPSLRIISA